MNEVSVVKRQHYIPEFYIKRFDSKEKVNVFDRIQDKFLVNQNPRNFFQMNYFYDLNEGEKLELLSKEDAFSPEVIEVINSFQGTEHYFSEVESRASSVMREIDSNPFLLFKEYNQNVMIEFMYILAYRTNLYRDRIKVMKDYYQKTPEKRGDFDSLREELKDISTPKQFQTTKIFDQAHIDNVIDLLMNDYEWNLLTVTNNLKLIMSDDPLQKIRIPYQEICFPLSSDLAIVLRHRSIITPFPTSRPIIPYIGKLSDEDVFKFNFWQTHHAQKYLWGDLKSLKYMDNRRKQPDYPRYID